MKEKIIKWIKELYENNIENFIKITLLCLIYLSPFAYGYFTGWKGFFGVILGLFLMIFTYIRYKFFIDIFFSFFDYKKKIEMREEIARTKKEYGVKFKR